MEAFLIFIIIIAQCNFFYLTLGKIKLLKTIFADAPQYTIERVTLLTADLQSVSPLVILDQLTVFEAKALEQADASAVNIGLLMPYNENPVSDIIIDSVNTYLLRNSGAAPDFNLIRDIAERNSDAIEEEINSTLSIPLYLGLLGTIIGIVVGMSHISGLTLASTTDAANTMLDNAISLLLNGVKVAMIASFTGLLLTVIHSGITLKTAKALNGRRKNAFFTFIQVELLPLLNDNLNATLYSLQSNLLSFNKDFGNNVQRLDGLMNKNYEALIAQGHFMDTLSKIDIMEFASANVTILNSLKSTVKSFSDFNEYVSAINTAIVKTDDVIVHLDTVLGRTDNLNDMACKLIGLSDQNEALMEFLKSHFAALNSSKLMVGTAVVDVNEYLSKAIDDLKFFTQEKIATVKAIEIHELGLMQNTYPDKWKNLDELKKMNQIIAGLSKVNGDTSDEMRIIMGSLDELIKVVSHLEKGIDVNIKWPFIRKVFRKWFPQKMAS